MRQPTPSDNGFEKCRTNTRKEQFHDVMEAIIPWQCLSEGLETYYPKTEGPGWPAVGLDRMLRNHLIQHRFNRSDPVVIERYASSENRRS